MKLLSKRTIQNSTLGFTLVELLVVISILGILATIGLVVFNSAQVRSRDTARKSDLRQIANALELFYTDYGYYPPVSGSGGQIMACPFTSLAVNTACTWGSGQLTDSKTVYLKTVPADPSSPKINYYYRTVSIETSPRQGFQLYAHLENSEDTKACIGGDCGSHSSDLPTNVTCGEVAGCNFSITSPNIMYDTN